MHDHLFPFMQHVYFTADIWHFTFPYTGIDWNGPIPPLDGNTNLIEVVRTNPLLDRFSRVTGYNVPS